MGFCIGVEFLLGRCMATSPNTRDQAEWPPHPDRLFMALVAAHHSGDTEPHEREALLWLESQKPPTIHCTPAAQRTVTVHYVPVNDTTLPRVKDPKKVSASVIDSALQVLPENRSRQARTFPVTVPEKTTLYYQWLADAAPELHRGLESLCSKVTSLGHSASLVWAWVGDPVTEGRVALSPAKKGRRLRVSHEGRLASLEESYSIGRRPSKGMWCNYDLAPEVQKNPPGTVFDPAFLVFEIVDRKRFGLRSTALLTDALRKTLMSRCPEPLPSWLSGHEPDGSPLQGDHAGFIPLPHVGRIHADGKLLGLAVVMPYLLRDPRNLDALFNLFDENGELREFELKLGQAGTVQLSLHHSGMMPTSLNPRTWSRPSKVWGTVTPIILDRHLKTKLPRGQDPQAAAEAQRRRDEEMEQIIRAACVRVGLPEPRVELLPVSIFEGSPSVWEFPNLVLARQGRRKMTHARLEFPREVSGPVLLGAGRYRGYGLCRPFTSREKESVS